MLKIGLVGLAAVAMVGCATQASDNAESSGNAIINGEETTGYTSVVALRGRVPGADKGMLCTATVVAPTVVLTAAHCVDPATAGEGNEYYIQTSHTILDPANPSPRIAVKEVHWDPEFSAQNLQGGHDIAVAILAEPTNLKPVKINRASLPELTSVRLVGYGLNDGINETGAGLKRTAEVPVASVDDKFVVTGSWFGTTMCSGDSGGPVLAEINGVETIVGVNSFGFIKCIGTGSSTRVDSYLSFVDQYVRR